MAAISHAHEWWRSLRDDAVTLAVRPRRTLRFLAEEIDQCPELERHVPPARIEQDEVGPLRAPVRQDGDQPAVGVEGGDQDLGQLHDADAIEARAQSEVE